MRGFQCWGWEICKVDVAVILERGDGMLAEALETVDWMWKVRRRQAGVMGQQGEFGALLWEERRIVAWTGPCLEGVFWGAYGNGADTWFTERAFSRNVWAAEKIYKSWASQVAQMVKSLPAMQETRVQSLGWEDPLEKEMKTYSSTLAWNIPWMEEPGRLQSMGSQRVRQDWGTSLSLSFFLCLRHETTLGHPWIGCSFISQCE